MTVNEKYLYWINNADNETVAELKALENDKDEVYDRFYRELEFGTGGMRGVIGAGSNRINKYTIAKATKGFAEYIKSCGEEACKKGFMMNCPLYYVPITIR